MTPSGTDKLDVLVEQLKTGCHCHRICDCLPGRAVGAIEQLQAENTCDVCGGSGTPISETPCMCSGTGKMSEAARSLREDVVRPQSQLSAETLRRQQAEHERDCMLEDLARLKKAIEEMVEFATSTTVVQEVGRYALDPGASSLRERET